MQVTYKDITINFDDVKTVLKRIQTEYPLYRSQLFNKLIEIPEFKDYFFKNYESYDDYRKNPNNCEICNSKCKSTYCSKCYKSEAGKLNRIKKIMQTKLEKYGDSNFNNIKKQNQTVREKYNVENVSQIPQVNKKIKEVKSRLDYELIKQKTKETCQKKYGADFPNQNNIVKDKAIKTNLEKYEVPFKSQVLPYIFDNIKDDTKVLNARNFISKELDIFIPSINLAIEYNGLMFHSQGISEHSMFNTPDFDKMYHLKKTLECKAKGITLFHIFEGEDLDLWLSMINNKLGLNERIFARKCEIREISNKECIEFLNSNHIQGYIPSKINIGLYYNFEYIDDFSKEKISKSTLVSLMTFSKPRFNNQYDYELIRFCSLKGFNVIGGASKLWKYFLKKYNPKSVISYANRRFSNGEVYQKLGFSLKGESGVNYFYFKDSLKLESRNKYQKHKLKNILEYYNPNESEQVNMFKNGYRRIFDCGNLVFEYIK